MCMRDDACTGINELCFHEIPKVSWNSIEWFKGHHSSQQSSSQSWAYKYHPTKLARAVKLVFLKKLLRWQNLTSFQFLEISVRIRVHCIFRFTQTFDQYMYFVNAIFANFCVFHVNDVSVAITSWSASSIKAMYSICATLQDVLLFWNSKLATVNSEMLSEYTFHSYLLERRQLRFRRLSWVLRFISFLRLQKMKLINDTKG